MAVYGDKKSHVSDASNNTSTVDEFIRSYLGNNSNSNTTGRKLKTTNTTQDSPTFRDNFIGFDFSIPIEAGVKSFIQESLNVKSFDIKVPGITYNLGFGEGSSGYYWRLFIQPININLLNDRNVSLSVGATCSDSYGTNCSLYSPLETLLDGFVSNSSLELALQSEDSNLITSILGNNHFIRLLKRNNNSVSTSKNRKLRTLEILHEDVDTYSSCILSVNLDGLFYVNIFSDESSALSYKVTIDYQSNPNVFFIMTNFDSLISLKHGSVVGSIVTSNANQFSLYFNILWNFDPNNIILKLDVDQFNVWNENYDFLFDFNAPYDLITQSRSFNLNINGSGIASLFGAKSSPNTYPPLVNYTFPIIFEFQLRNPVVSDTTGMSYASTYDNCIYSYFLQDNNCYLKWHKCFSYEISTPVLAESDNILFFLSSQGALVSICTIDGNLIWSYVPSYSLSTLSTPKRPFNNKDRPILSLLVDGENNYITFVGLDGDIYTLFGFSDQSYQLKWTRSDSLNSVFNYPTAIGNQILIAITSDCRGYVFKIFDGSYALLSYLTYHDNSYFYLFENFGSQPATCHQQANLNDNYYYYGWLFSYMSDQGYLWSLDVHSLDYYTFNNYPVYYDIYVPSLTDLGIVNGYLSQDHISSRYYFNSYIAVYNSEDVILGILDLIYRYIINLQFWRE